MKLRPFPHGANGFGYPSSSTKPVITTGNVFFVDSGIGRDLAINGVSPDAPLATIDYAVGKCTANNGDVIFVLPGHAETLGADSWIDVDVAGVSVIGLGTGPSRPTLSCSVTATDPSPNVQMSIGANGVTIKNLLFTPTVSAVKYAISIDAGITDTNLIDVSSTFATANLEFVDFIIINAGCTRTNIDGLVYTAPATVSDAQTAISIVGASDRVRIANFWIEGTGGAWVAGIQGITALSTRILIEDGVIVTDAEPGIELLTGTTGSIRDVRIFSDLATIDAATVADGCAHFNVLYCELGNEAGTLVKTESADD